MLRIEMPNVERMQRVDMTNGERMQRVETTPAVARRPLTPALPAAGAALVALAVYAAVAARQPLLAAIAGSGGLFLLRMAMAERPYSSALIAIDAAAFALFAFLRNDGLGFWQLPGPWVDVFRFNLPSAAIALIVYAGASVMALIGGSRGLRPIEALSLIAVPFLFNLLVTIEADWHMAEIGAFVTAHASLPFAAQVAIGRALTLWFLGEAMLILVSLVSVNRLPHSARTHVLFAASGIIAAATPLFANSAQLVAQPLAAIVFSSLCAALAQGGLVGDRLSDDGSCARLAGWPAAALRFRLGPLADGSRERRDLRRAVYGVHPRRGARSARSGDRGDAEQLCARGRRAHWRAALPARHDRRGQRRRNGAVLRPPQGRLSRSARACSRRRRRIGPGARLRIRSRLLRRQRALSRDVRRRGAVLRGRRPRVRRSEHRARRAETIAELAALCARSWRSAASSRGRSGGISIPPSFRS